jgi:hypothetical protein
VVSAKPEPSLRDLVDALELEAQAAYNFVEKKKFELNLNSDVDKAIREADSPSYPRTIESLNEAKANLKEKMDSLKELIQQQEDLQVKANWIIEQKPALKDDVRRWVGENEEFNHGYHYKANLDGMDAALNSIIKNNNLKYEPTSSKLKK